MRFSIRAHIWSHHPLRDASFSSSRPQLQLGPYHGNPSSTRYIFKTTNFKSSCYPSIPSWRSLHTTLPQLRNKGSIPRNTETSNKARAKYEETQKRRREQTEAQMLDPETGLCKDLSKIDKALSHNPEARRGIRRIPRRLQLPPRMVPDALI